MNKKDILIIYKALEKAKIIGDIKFKYPILKNLKLISNETDTLIDVEKSIEQIMSPIYEKRNEFILQLGDKKDDGSIALDVSDAEKVEKFNKLMQPVFDEHKDIIKKYEDENKQYDLLLKEKIEIPEFIKINISDCPSDVPTDILEVLINYGIVD